MIDKFDRVVVTFSRWNESIGDMEHVEKVARTDDELRAILSDMEYIDWKFTQVGYVRCACGREVACQHFTNTCDCGRDYNRFGEELAPRSQWGYETGEHWSECL